MAATTSLSRIVLCNTATVSISYIRCLRSERHRRDCPGAGNPPPPSTEFPAAGQPPLAPRSYESRDGNPPTFSPENFSAAPRPPSHVPEWVRQSRAHRATVSDAERPHAGAPPHH